MEIGRDIITVGKAFELLAKVDGKRVRFVFPDHDVARKTYRKLRRNGAGFLDVYEEGQRFRWASAPVARDLAGTTW